MPFARTCALFAALSCAALPALAQNAAPGQDAASAMAPSTSYANLRDSLADQTSVLTTDVTRQRAILKRNQELLKEAQRLDAANKKMIAEKQHMIQMNAELEKQRAALAQTDSQLQSQAGATQGAPAEKPAPAPDVTLAKASPTGPGGQ